MPARNDSSAVAKAAKAVDREAMAAVVRSLLADRLPRSQPAPPESQSLDELYRELEDARPSPVSAPTQSSASPSPISWSRRKSPSRTSAAEKAKLVSLCSWGKWPRYGTKRYAKSEAVRAALRDVHGGSCRASRLLGLPYDSGNAAKPGSITFHDLEVMADKGLIKIEENDK